MVLSFSEAPTNSSTRLYSSNFVNDAWDKGELLPANLYCLNSSPMKRNAVAQSRSAFTPQEDKEIFVYVRDHRAAGIEPTGCEYWYKIMSDIPSLAVRHTWQSVKERYLKNLQAKRTYLNEPTVWHPNSSQENSQPEPPAQQNGQAAQPPSDSPTPTRSTSPPQGETAEPHPVQNAIKENSLTPRATKSTPSPKRKRVLFAETAQNFLDASKKPRTGSEVPSGDDPAIRLDPASYFDLSCQGIECVRGKLPELQNGSIARELCMELYNSEPEKFPPSLRQDAERYGSAKVAVALDKTCGNIEFSRKLLTGTELPKELVWGRAEDDLIEQLLREYPMDKAILFVSLLAQDRMLTVGPRNAQDGLTPGMMLVIEKHGLEQTKLRVGSLGG
eukprot:c11828_g1_i1.p1 GENE.c11828_g1_i1~~c11828_g1_i1.p1  ORF type:complete len:452 (+),score=81.27 c11828_g1_i1:193-1356(+)